VNTRIAALLFVPLRSGHKTARRGNPVRYSNPHVGQVDPPVSAPHPNPLPACGEREAKPEAGEGDGGQSDLLARLAADLRNGAFETTPSRESVARAILWRLVLAKLREANPQFLAANGFK
jgi:hypothetical protein